MLREDKNSWLCAFMLYKLAPLFDVVVAKLQELHLAAEFAIDAVRFDSPHPTYFVV